MTKHTRSASDHLLFSCGPVEPGPTTKGSADQLVMLKIIVRNGLSWCFVSSHFYSSFHLLIFYFKSHPHIFPDLAPIIRVLLVNSSLSFQLTVNKTVNKLEFIAVITLCSSFSPKFAAISCFSISIFTGQGRAGAGNKLLTPFALQSPWHVNTGFALTLPCKHWLCTHLAM